MLKGTNQMIMPVNALQSNLLFKAIQSKLPDGKTEANQQVRTSIFYINDFHGKSINIERTITASRAFDHFEPSLPTDKLKFSSGDIQLGEPVEANKVMVEAQNIMGIMASAMGNHEFDMPDHISELIPHMGYKMLACNINIKPDNPLSHLRKLRRHHLLFDHSHRSKRHLLLTHYIWPQPRWPLPSR